MNSVLLTLGSSPYYLVEEYIFQQDGTDSCAIPQISLEDMTKSMKTDLINLDFDNDYIDFLFN